MSETKRSLGLTNCEIAELINDLNDYDFYEVMLELGKINTIKEKQIQNREEFIEWLNNVLYEIETYEIS